MAIYLCEKCDEMKDADYDPPTECGDMNLVCTNCMEEIEESKFVSSRFISNRGSFEAFFNAEYTESDDE